jgi:tRNA A37 threonylcarbamoyladenosine synthetase subunit TsaC/SUA5/YrdC
MSKETNPKRLNLPEREPSALNFEGIDIQMEKSRWDFQTPEGEQISLDTYSIWDRKQWPEIAEKLAEGQVCALYMAGNYGVGKILESPEWQEPEDIGKEAERLRKIKRRSEEQPFVAFVHPDDQIDVIDVNQLHPNFKHLRWAHKRHEVYGWAQHNIFPYRKNGTLDSAVVKDDGTIACFWIPNHWGYEGLIGETRKLRKHGVFGGSSLNIHENEPSYTTEDLYNKLPLDQAWLDEIDFVIFDEIAEAAQIGRSHTQISFTGEKPQLVRRGSYSVARIQHRTGYIIEEPDGARLASSTTPYDEENNAIVDTKVESAEAKIERLKTFMKEYGL